MTKKKNRLAAALSREIDLQMIAEVGHVMKHGMTAEFLKASGQHGSKAIDSLFVIGW